MEAPVTIKQTERARALFCEHGGVLRTRDALKLGIHPRTLYALRDAGVLECLSRGLYRLVDSEQLEAPDLITVAHKIPQGVMCLISALHFHNITTQIPHFVSVAVKRGSEKPRLAYPPTKIYFFSEKSFSEGIDTSIINSAKVKVYSPEKTLADAFKFREKIGMDTIRESMDLYRQHFKPKPGDLIRYAKTCRVEKIMRPYLQAVL